MSNYKSVINPYDGKLTIVRAESAFAVKESVATYNDLPISGNNENDLRITKDTDYMYTWSTSSSNGNLSDWQQIGSVSSVDWSAITNKPSSSVGDIDDAVSKKHTQGSDTTLGSMTADVNMNTHKLTNLSAPSANGDSIRATTIITETNLEKITDKDLEVGAINYVIDGGGSAITTGEKDAIRVPFDCTITSVTLLADQSGSIVIDIWKDTYANYAPTVADTITASAKPTLSSAIKNEDTTLTGWTKTISSGDVLKFNVDSCSTITKCTLILGITRT